MDRPAPRYHPSGRRFVRPRQAVPAPSPVRHSAATASLILLMRLVVALVVVAALVLLGPGFLLDAPQPTPHASDAIVVISGDEQMARFAEGVNLYQQGFGKYLVFSGAAYDNGTSNADVMRTLAVQQGIPDSAILEEPLGEDTWGNAVYTRRVLEDNNLQSAILVTSPYHLRRAQVTFDAAYAGSGIQLTVHAAPDSQWRKLSWWQQAETRRLTFTELQKLAYIAATGQYH
ncbi:MAG: YdcF family protein [Chloroflexi bacterium]|nr:YdcF family protein [Chloroflexota bacterium]